MDNLQKYLNYSSDDFVEDGFFWKWVLEEDKENDSIWKEFIETNSDKTELIEKAKERVLQLNAESYTLSNERVVSLWSKIQQSKNKITNLKLTTLLP